MIGRDIDNFSALLQEILSKYISEFDQILLQGAYNNIAEARGYAASRLAYLNMSGTISNIIKEIKEKVRSMDIDNFSVLLQEKLSKCAFENDQKLLNVEYNDIAEAKSHASARLTYLDIVNRIPSLVKEVKEKGNLNDFKDDF